MSEELKEGGNMKMKPTNKKVEAPVVEETKVEQEPIPVDLKEVEAKAVTYDDDTIKVNMDFGKEPEPTKEDVIEAPIEAPIEVVTEDTIVEPEAPDEPLEEVITEVTDEVVDEMQVDLEEAIEEAEAEGKPLPENIQKVVEFMEETGGTLEDYVKLNQDYSELDEDKLLAEYYQASKPHLDAEEVEFLLDDEFTYDEDIDDEREIKKKKIAKKEQLSEAKKYLDSQKDKYYSEIKSGSRLAPEQKKAVEFFNRYTKENEVTKANVAKQSEVFQQGTSKVFTDKFKGFDYAVGDKKYRFNVKNTAEVKETQSDLNNFVKKFLNDKNEMVDAKGYHKSLFTAMNSDAIANHFYEQGKADAMKDSIARSKNVAMDPRSVHEKVTTANGWSVRAVPSEAKSASQFKIKKIT